MSGIRQIRRNVLRLTQVGLARVCKVGQPTVSRWERGIGSPKHVHLSRMRSYAIRTGIAWNDSILFAGQAKPTRVGRSTQKRKPVLSLTAAASGAAR